MTARRRPSKEDVSRPLVEDYAYKKAFYQRADVVRDYDFHRFGSPERLRRNRRKWRAIERALAAAPGVRSVLDVPCGTGRFTGAFGRLGLAVFGSDISLEMLRQAREKSAAEPHVAGFVQADAEALPLGSGTVDCVVCIRFMLHVDPGTRVRILRELARVSRRWLIVDYRHRYTLRWLKGRVARALGRQAQAPERVTRAQLERELTAAGVALRRVIPVARLFSDKWIVLGEAGRA